MSWPVMPFQHGPGAQTVVVNTRTSTDAGGGVDTPAAPATSSVLMSLQIHQGDSGRERSQEATADTLKLDGWVGPEVAALSVGQTVKLTWAGQSKTAEIRSVEPQPGFQELVLEAPL